MRKVAVLLAALICSPATAQNSIVIPNGFATSEGSTNNAFPWASNSALWGGLRTISLYGSANFTAQAVTFPVAISRLRWRADGSATQWTGGQFHTATIRMATAAVSYSAPSTILPANFGPDLTTVYSGAVTFSPGTGSSPGPWVVDVTLSAPFVYDPSGGDLAIDVDINNAGGTSYVGGPTPQLDVDNSGTTQASRVFCSSFYPVANGITVPHGVIVEVTYSPSSSAAQAVPYGLGCYDRTGTFYENFGTPSSFDLSNSGLSMIFNGSDIYTVRGALTGYLPPSGAAVTLVNGNGVQQTVSLASPLPVVGGTTTTLTICSNGLVSSGPGNGTSATPLSAQFLAFPQTCWATWHDFNPTLGGAVKFEEVGNVSYVTWVGVADQGGVGTSTFQFQFNRSNGWVHIIWGSMSASGNGYLIGYHLGGSATDPGNRDLSVSLPATFTVGRDISALDLTSSSRPLLGSTISLMTGNVPLSSPIGVSIMSVTGFNPGVQLGALGMPGCSQYVGLDDAVLFVAVGGQGSRSFSIPNVPSYSGIVLYSQSAAFSVGANALGVISSNGLMLRAGTQ